ncbi:hypothetical protein GBAR_LOCUS23905 [Geodia barretti]|uniref:Uncharacterized protein n=1 Tax=Geodia barretti TaxID=519541 RepID=A0AA35T864_GEOBA|nr:hypothetical protein GBAR_LOCUS23905 [Geodia barretti]
MEIAEVKAEGGKEWRPYDEYRGERPQYNYEGVISLLREHCKKNQLPQPVIMSPQTVAMTVLLPLNRTALLSIRTLLPLNRTS